VDQKIDCAFLTINRLINLLLISLAILLVNSRVIERPLDTVDRVEVHLFHGRGQRHVLPGRTCDMQT